MSDESNNQTSDPTGSGTAERVGFCQDCGTPLTRETVRAVGTGVFCEPCLTTRVGATGPGYATGYTASAGATTPGYTTVPNAGPVPPAAPPVAPPIEGTPHPFLAGLLSIIPGVGTMYNGQYAKGIAHLLIFVVLNSLGEHDHLGVFKLLALVWYIYQIIDAYQTAKARLEGAPLPNPFGLNEIGERMGMGKGWGTSQRTTAAGVPPAPGAGFPTADYQPPYAPVNYPPTAGVPVSNGPDWVGYVPPTNFASPGVPPVVPPVTAAQVPPAWGHAPYSATYTGSDNPYSAAVPLVAVAPAPRRFPAGAIWLIGLGALFLLIEFTEQWGFSVNGNWIPALIFAALAAWSFTYKLKSGLPIVCVLRWPLELATLALLFALQALDVVSLGRTWPVLFIVFGVTLILERTALANLHHDAALPYDPLQAEQTRAAWATPPPPEPPADSSDNDLTKSGGL
jgi:hypothetical protein